MYDKPEYPKQVYAGWFDPCGVQACTKAEQNIYESGWRDGLTTVLVDGFLLLAITVVVVGLFTFIRDSFAEAVGKVVKNG